MGLTLIIASNCNKDEISYMIKDSDGNLYNSVTIGTQVWMVENLKTTKFSDGSSIPMVTSNSEWVNCKTGAFCWYENNVSTYKPDYGALYNWYAVNTGKLCPDGWHIPTKTEWEELNNYLGGENISGGKMKETGSNHWNSPNNGATNESGFTGLPGGFRYDAGIFNSIGNDGIWWSATQDNIYTAWFLGLNYKETGSYMGTNDKYLGFSIRCLKNNKKVIIYLPPFCPQ